MRLFGRSNERFHVHGGNDLIVKGVAGGLDGQITTGTRLTSIRRQSGGGYRLSFDGGREVAADTVVLAVPFAVMRESVDYAKAGFSALKRTAIQEMGMGTNTKLQLQFDSRPWVALGSNGESTADTGYQLTWEVTRAQPGRAGILVGYTGGRIGDSFGKGSPRSHARRFLDQLDPVLPGVAKTWNGRVALNFWAADPLANGSYSYYRVGQLTGFSGVEREPSGTLPFRGRAHVDRVPGLSRGRRPERPAGRRGGLRGSSRLEPRPCVCRPRPPPLASRSLAALVEEGAERAGEGGNDGDRVDVEEQLEDLADVVLGAATEDAVRSWDMEKRNASPRLEICVPSAWRSRK